MSVSRALRRYVPVSLVRFRSVVQNTTALQHVRRLACDTAALGRLDAAALDRFFHPEAAEHREWVRAEREIADLLITTRAGGVNPGDRRAIYHLVLGLEARRVLEVGTHIGSSTVSIACAQRRLRARMGDPSFSLSTVDIRDVNDPVSKPWLKLGSMCSPGEMVASLGCGEHVSFSTGPSLRYLEQGDGKYDLIFLDGDHSAATVYCEIPAALKRLAPGGLILVHDYFPDLKPLWSDRSVSPGPFLAASRLRAEGAGLRVRPLGRLPWPTKLGSRVTSLALIERQPC